MSTKRLVAAVAAVAALLLISADPASAAPVRKVFANMNGLQEPPGDPDGTGAFVMTVKPDLGVVCAEVGWANIDEDIAMHIHSGVVGVSGPIVINLESIRIGAARCIKGLDPELLAAIRANPAGYYCNVHTELYPAGAIRGQLQASQ